ncbi:oxidoreductase [Rhodobium orientis]|uniref:Oxidoreductase n=2 Tax=Rhodobium orientis TaxID=34017 RepID=A0A327JKJ2_9HYPH|nr:oxidoreductase [Rhodobium orientis]RAI26960.1 oxidoreductase [Rhodobium orientis]
MTSLKRSLAVLAVLSGLSGVLSAGFASGPAVATALEAKPTGTVILQVSGKISATNAGDEAHFDLDMLKGMPAATFNTSTVWTDGENSFTGVPLKDLLATLGAHGRTLRATAINDYAVRIPVSDAVSPGPIVAYAMNGKSMSRRGKGPLWIVYPFDQHSRFQSETIYSRSIWQLDRLEVID